MTTSILNSNADTSGYRDRKRYAWLLSVIAPLAAPAGPWLYLQTGQTFWLWAFLAFFYFGMPVLDRVFGEDRSNPPESAVPALEADSYYRYITWAVVPLLWFGFVFNVVFLATHQLHWIHWLAVVLTTGNILGFGLNLGHELGHKKTWIDRKLALLTLSLGGYGHFSVEHNRGHHRWVATPEDPASSRMGESIWRFVFREMPGAFFRAWDLEEERLARSGKSVWHLDNEILQAGIITLALVAATTAGTTAARWGPVLTCRDLRSPLGRRLCVFEADRSLVRTSDSSAMPCACVGDEAHERVGVSNAFVGEAEGE